MVALDRNRSIQEHEVLRIFGTLPSAEAFEHAASEALRWAEKRAGKSFPKEARLLEEFESFSGGRNNSAVKLVLSGHTIWALRSEDPDKAVPGRIWTTEVVVGCPDNGLPQLSIRQLANTSEGELAASPHTPGLAHQISDKCGFYRGQYRLTAEVKKYDSETDVLELIQMLEDNEREIPFVVATIPEGKNKPYVDVNSLARATLGLARVSLLSDEATWHLTNEIGKRHSVFNGGVRVYQPNFSRDSSPFLHRLFVGSALKDKVGRENCERAIRVETARSSILTSKLGTNVLAFGQVKQVSRRLAQEVLAKKNASDPEQLKAAKSTIEALTYRVEELDRDNSFYSDEHAKAEERAVNAEQRLVAANGRIQDLLLALENSGGEVQQARALPSSWDQFALWVDQELAGRVVLTSRARRQLKNAEFENVETAANCLLWLANDCHKLRRDGGEPVSEAPVLDGIRNSRCGGDTFEINWEGRTQAVDWHIKTGGNSRDPRRCLRIYYFWDEMSQTIVIAEMPAHRRTAAT